MMAMRATDARACWSHAACIRNIAKCSGRTQNFRACRWRNFRFDNESGQADFDDLGKKITNDTAAVIVQSPNFFGIVENVKHAAALAHEKGALLVVIFSEAVALGIVEPPRDADIVAGELQSFAISPAMAVLSPESSRARRNSSGRFRDAWLAKRKTKTDGGRSASRSRRANNIFAGKKPRRYVARIRR